MHEKEVETLTLDTPKPKPRQAKSINSSHDMRVQTVTNERKAEIELEQDELKPSSQRLNGIMYLVKARKLHAWIYQPCFLVATNLKQLADFSLIH